MNLMKLSGIVRKATGIHAIFAAVLGFDTKGVCFAGFVMVKEKWESMLMTDLDKDALLPCPFCGDEAETLISEDTSEPTVGCSNVECGLTFNRSFFTEAEAIAAWNRRPRHGEER